MVVRFSELNRFAPAGGRFAFFSRRAFSFMSESFVGERLFLVTFSRRQFFLVPLKVFLLVTSWDPCKPRQFFCAHRVRGVLHNTLWR